MRPRKRFWRFAAYAGPIGCAITLAAYAFSAAWFVDWCIYPGCDIYLGRGGVEFCWTGFQRPFGLPGVEVGSSLGPFQWWFLGHVDGSIFVPLWFPLLLFAALTAFAWFRSRQQRLPGRCARCGYDLTGNVTRRCPECGVSVADSQTHPR